MGEHYSKSTVEVTVWCNRCNKQTRHRVDDGRLGPCLECLDRRVAPAAPVAPEPEPPKQGEMF